MMSRICVELSSPTATRDALVNAGRRVVLLDDDPTGTQAVANVPVVTAWREEDLTWGLSAAHPALFVLTNNRARGAADAARVTNEVALAALGAAEQLGLQTDFVVRGDSTLRGHFPLETDILAEVCANRGQPVDAVVVCPAYPQAGRVTMHGTHYVARDGVRVPVAETEFARDATFGYRSSDLREWVAERSDGRWDATAVRHLDIDVVRSGPAAVADTLVALRGGGQAAPVTVDAENDADLDAVAAGLIEAERGGLRVVVRAGPSFARARAGLLSRPPLRPEQMPDRSVASCPHGLVVVGSHTALTTAQVDAARSFGGSRFLELDVAAVLDPATRSTAVDDIAAEAAHALRRSDVLLTTSRERLDGLDQDDSLRLAADIADAVVNVTRRVVAQTPPRWLVAKGGITSSDVITKVLTMSRARALGTCLPGMVPIWADAGAEAGDKPLCVIFPGNVGEANSLALVVDMLRRLS